MKKLLLFVVLTAFQCGNFRAQILNVPQVIQEQNQWCWAACTKSILDYYGYPHQQCEIAEYARSVITWHNFGPTDCCVNTTHGCNYWNYNYGMIGSMQDILVHFGNISNYGVSGALTSSEISTNMSLNRPYILRWEWNDGSGHFLVGHGINGNDVNYMNPWFGEGLHVSTYDWLVADGTHTWTHTNVLSISMDVEQILNENQQIGIAPNPGTGLFTISGSKHFEKMQLCNLLGETILEVKDFNTSAPLDLSSLPKGMYLLKFFEGSFYASEKIILE